MQVCRPLGWKRQTSQQRNQNPLTYARMHYLPLKPRLQRLSVSRSTAEYMRWHHEHRRDDGILCHPSDGVTWKDFNNKYPNFAVEPRNVRLGLYTDGFNPYTLSWRSYSIWPVVVILYGAGKRERLVSWITAKNGWTTGGNLDRVGAFHWIRIDVVHSPWNMYDRTIYVANLGNPLL